MLLSMVDLYRSVGVLYLRQIQLHAILFSFQPSFGYMITSPEKREPFALIRPSDFASRNVSVHSETVQLTDADHTMIAGKHWHYTKTAT